MKKAVRTALRHLLLVAALSVLAEGHALAFSACVDDSECASGVCGSNGICCLPECMPGEVCEEDTGLCPSLNPPTPTPTFSPGQSDGCAVAPSRDSARNRLAALVVGVLIAVRRAARRLRPQT